MKNDNSGWGFMVFMLFLFLALAVVTAVLCSDMPAWAKWLILTR